MEIATTCDTAGNTVAVGRTGTFWSGPPRVKLGEYDYGETGSVQDSNRVTLGRFREQVVIDVEGRVIGRWDGIQLLVGNTVVGTCIGCSGAKALSIVLFHLGRFSL